MNLVRAALLLTALCPAALAAAEAQPLVLRGHVGTVLVVAFSPDGKRLATSANDGAVRMWSLDGGGREVWRVGGQQAMQTFAWSLSFAPDGRTLAAAGGDAVVRLYDAENGREKGRLEGHQEIVWCVAYSPDGKLLASGSVDGTARVWDAARRKEVRRFDGVGQPWALAFSPDGATLAVGHQEGAVVLWDVAGGREVRQWDTGSGVWPLAFTPDGRTIATTTWGQGPVRLWEAATGRERGQFVAPGGTGWTVALGPDGRSLLGSFNAAALLWDLPSGKSWELKAPNDRVHCVAFSPDGRSAAAGTQAGTVLVWRELPERPRPARVLTPQEIERQWEALSGAEGAGPFRAVLDLADASPQAVPLLRGRLKPAKVDEPDPKRVARLIADLDSDDFETRERATRELEKVGPAAAPLLRRAMASGPPLETRKRMQEMLDRWAGLALTPDDLRSLRAVEALERMADARARGLLDDLAAGPEGALLSREARAAVRRLSRPERP
jgi:hypothetical protein